MRSSVRWLAAFCASVVLLQPPVRACTSFAVYGRQTWYGMNFDHADWDIRLSVSRASGQAVFRFEFGAGLQLAAMNEAGLFANLQILDQNVRQNYTNMAGGLSIGTLYENAITSLRTVAEVDGFIGARRVIPWDGQELHSLIADRSGGAMIVEPFGSSHGVVRKEGAFIVMTNLPHTDFVGRGPESVYGVGADRYQIAHRYISEHLDDFGYEEAFATLERSVQGADAYFPTRASFVLNPDTREVFLCFARDFSKVWRLSMDDGTIETVSGFERNAAFRIGPGGLWVSGLRTSVGAGTETRPVWTGQPKHRAAAVGERVVLSGAATGTGMTYQWLRNGAAVEGAEATTLVFEEMRPADAGIYRKTVTNATGTLVSERAIVGVGCLEKAAVGAVEVERNRPRKDGGTYDQWRMVDAAAAIAADHEKGKATRVSFLDLDGDLVQVELSGPGTLSVVLDGATGPVVPEKYEGATRYMKGHAGIVITGANETTNVSVFSVGRATEEVLVRVKDGAELDGTADIAFIAITSENGKFGSVRTGNVSYFAERGVTGLYAPGVVFQGVVEVGDVTAFGEAEPVLVSGSANEVRVVGGDVEQANDAAVTVSGVRRIKFAGGEDAQGRALTAKVNRGVFKENGRDVTASLVVREAVSRASAGGARFLGIATRARSGAGSDATIGGFVIDGDSPRRVLIRAVGPTLATQGIAEAEVLADPMIALHDAKKGNEVIATNDDWGRNPNAAEIETVTAQLGVAALAAGDTRSSALLTELMPGVYTFVVSAKGGAPGVVLVEVYDVDPPVEGTRFAAISTRARVATGSGVAIGGFVIEGAEPKRVLVRAVGPTLATQGVGAGEVLADPEITLHRGAPAIATNDDWETNGNAAEIVMEGSRVGASPLAETDGKSAALLATLEPGAYSFVVRGKNDTSGVVLVEVYDAD